MRRLAAASWPRWSGVVAVAAGALARERPAEMEQLAAASGALALSNSAADAAIITAYGLMPGEAVGQITLGNTGEAAGLLVLARTAITDVPGPNGGRLSDALTLLIEDVTRRPRRARSSTARSAGSSAWRSTRSPAARAHLPVHGRVPRHGARRRGQRVHRLGRALRLRVARGGAPLPPAATPTPAPGPGGNGGDRPRAAAGAPGRPGPRGQDARGPLQSRRSSTCGSRTSASCTRMRCGSTRAAAIAAA